MRKATTATILFLVAATATAAAVMLVPRSATADDPVPRCVAVSGQLAEDPGGASCPTDHPNCFIGAIHGKKLEATTLFYGEGSVAAPPASPGWFAYSGVTTYTTENGPIVTRETGLVSNFNIPGGPGRASLSMEVITSGGTGYLFVNGFVDANRHVTSQVSGTICTP